VFNIHFTEQYYIHIPKYNTYATNHLDGTAHAGSSIKHHELAKYEMGHIQATNIRIKDCNRNLTTSAIYCPQCHTIKKEQYNAYINTLGHRFLVGGDFNAKHHY
jgi:hypothetical protein